MSELRLFTLPDIPMVQTGDDLVSIILAGVAAAGESLQDGDVVLIAQKIISKAEGRLIQLPDVVPTEAAQRLADETEKDPRVVQLILDESTEIVRQRAGAMIVRHRLGFVGANAGIDQSNIAPDSEEVALLLPVDPDASAAQLRGGLKDRCGCNVGVLINDSMGRPWRLGTLGLAIGSAGITTLDDRRGDADIYGRELKITMIGRADELAAAGSLLMGQADEKSPVVIARGLAPEDSEQTAGQLNRPAHEDLFR